LRARDFVGELERQELKQLLPLPVVELQFFV
jgi:hypothetical protein